MRKSVLAILFTTVSFGSCSSVSADGGSAATEARSVPAFSSIALNGVGTVRIHSGPRAVRVTMDASLMDRYETKVLGDTLFLGLRCGFGGLRALRHLKTCEIDITMPEIEGISSNGAGTILVDAFAYETLTISMTGAGYLELRGAASELMISCTGAGRIHAGGLIAESGRVSMTGGGHVEVRVEDELDVSVTGAGEILYRGNPDVKQKISGAGGIRRVGD